MTDILRQTSLRPELTVYIFFDSIQKCQQIKYKTFEYIYFIFIFQQAEMEPMLLQKLKTEMKWSKMNLTVYELISKQRLIR